MELNGVRNNIKMDAMPSSKKFKEPPTAPESSSFSQLRILKNLFIVCFGFFFLYLPFQSLANLQSSMNVENNIGVVSQTVIYATVILSALFLPKLVIRKFGCKNALVICILTYVPYFAANFYPHVATFVPTAILLGIGCGPLWSAKCTYINEISVLYSADGKDTADVITSRFFGIFFMVFQNTQIWGNLISFYVLRPREAEGFRDNLLSYNSTFHPLANSGYDFKNLSCGAEFCGGMNENLLPPSEEKRYMLIGVYMCSVLLSALIVFLFLDPLGQCSKRLGKKEGVCSRAVATLKHLRNTNQLLLVPLTIFNGIEQAFILGDYSKAYVACAWGLHNVGLVFICYGVVNAAMSFMAGRLVKYIPRMALMLVGAAGNMSVCTTLLLWRPNSEEFFYFFVLVGLWGLSDAIWLTQINSLYGVLFRAEEEAAFANFKLWESVGFSLAFGYSIFLCVADKIYILLTFLIIGITGYITVEIRNCIRRETYKVSEK